MQKISFLTAISFAAGVGALLPGQSKAQVAQPAYVAPSPGFYLLGQPYVRLDAGGAFSFDQHYHDAQPGSADAPLASGENLSGGVNPTGAFDVGLGARVAPYLRWDATLSYIPAMDFHGSDTFVPGSTAQGDVDSLVGMLNAYLDLAGLGYSFGVFQPYLDGGIGAASNHLDGVDTSTANGNFAGGTHTSLAWGLGAGVAMPLAPSTVFDVSYKYLDLGSAESGTTDATGTISPIKAGIRTNLVLAGVRLGF